MPLLMYTMARNTLAGRLGWGPSYAVTAVKHEAKLGLQQVGHWCCSQEGGQLLEVD
jgi:hypothetical protein